MATKIVMPKLGYDMEEGKLLRWHKKEGEEVKRGEVIAEVETEKADVEVESPASGVVAKLLIGEGTTVPVGETVGLIGEKGEKVDVEAETAEKERISENGDAKKEPREAVDAAAAEEAAPSAGAASQPPPTGRIKASPLARRLAQETGVELSQVRGSGPYGRIIKRDIETFEDRRPRAEAAAPPAAARTQELSMVRKTIARRMVQSKQTVPHFYVTAEIDMAEAMMFRSRVNESASDEDKISVNDLIIKACVAALQEFPELNASYREDKVEYHSAINVGVAVATDRGLLSPVISNCEDKSLGQIGRASKAIARRARDGKLSAEDMTPGTFTVSNLGMFGVESFTAIINPPEAAILAVGAVRDVPVAENGEIKAGKRMKATISCDHRLTDGAQAAQFLQKVKESLENPMRLVL